MCIVPIVPLFREYRNNHDFNGLGFPEFQWNQIEPRVYMDFSEIFPQKKTFF